MFEPMNFIYNLKYMGVGMLGVFIIIGIIMAATYAMGKIKTDKTDKDDGDQ
ncbi:MAG: sodium pump decarboxylase gamma subunit [Clostridia bacterium]|nr:sodium pump decarboxylase gamma subunit [Clostridia bacterium]